MVVNDFSNFKWNRFLKEHLDIIKTVEQMLDKFMAKIFIIEYIWIDNAGENKEFVKKCKQKGKQVEMAALHSL